MNGRLRERSDQARPRVDGADRALSVRYLHVRSKESEIVTQVSSQKSTTVSVKPNQAKGNRGQCEVAVL